MNTNTMPYLRRKSLGQKAKSRSLDTRKTKA